MRNVAVLAFDRVPVFEFAVPCEVFGVDRSDIHRPWYGFRVCAADPPPLRTGAGFTIDAVHGLEGLDWADTVVVPAFPYRDRDPPRPALDALRDAYERGARLMSLCTGAFVLAAAGVLDGRRATTHWMHAEDLARCYPRVRVDPGVLYVDDGQVLTSAGTAAGIDLCLHVVRRDMGADAANAVARRMVVPPHRDGGQAQYVTTPVPTGDVADPLGEVLVWMAEHLDEAVTVADLAARAAMSPRSFARHFRATTGTTPLRWLNEQRVREAQRLLETTGDTVDRIAARCGFGTATNLRKHFRRATSTSPDAYRRAFRRKAS